MGGPRLSGANQCVLDIAEALIDSMVSLAADSARIRRPSDGGACETIKRQSVLHWWFLPSLYSENMSCARCQVAIPIRADEECSEARLRAIAIEWAAANVMNVRFNKRSLIGFMEKVKRIAISDGLIDSCQSKYPVCNSIFGWVGKIDAWKQICEQTARGLRVPIDFIESRWTIKHNLPFSRAESFPFLRPSDPVKRIVDDSKADSGEARTTS
jgi:hypothetical protein